MEYKLGINPDTFRVKNEHTATEIEVLFHT